MLSTSTWSCSPHHKLVAVARWLGQWFAQAGGSCLEVWGHTAHPWNDLADSLARQALASGTGVGCIDFHLCHKAVGSGDIDWASLQPLFSALLAPCRVHNQLEIQPALRRTTHPHVADTHEEQWHRIDFTVATANVLALSQDGDWLPQESASSRAERLDQQRHQQGIAVVGLQESRRAEGRYATTHYNILASGALTTRGAPHGGCELWLHKSLPFMRAQDHSVSFAQLRPVVSMADPRRLVGHLHGQTMSCSFVVLDAPCRSQQNNKIVLRRLKIGGLVLPKFCVPQSSLPWRGSSSMPMHR